MSIGKRIRQRRKFLEFTQQELADKVGVGQSFICNLETEKNKRSTCTRRLAKVLGVSVEWLETGNKDPQPLMAQPPAEFSPLIIELIKLMAATDERGQEKILIAAKDAIDAHDVWKKAISTLAEKDITAIIQQLSQKALDKVIKTVTREVNEDYDPESVDPKNTHH